MRSGPPTFRGSAWSVARNLSLPCKESELRGMLYIAVGLAVALVATDLLEVSQRRLTRRRIGEP